MTQFTYTKADRCIRSKGKIVGRVYQDADTKLWQARINGTTGPWTGSETSAFNEAFARMEGYPDLATRNADVQKHNAQVRQNQKVARQRAGIILNGLLSDDKSAQDAAFAQLFQIK